MILIVIACWLAPDGRVSGPSNAPVVSWEATAFLAARWPWALAGCWPPFATTHRHLRRLPRDAEGRGPGVARCRCGCLCPTGSSPRHAFTAHCWYPKAGAPAGFYIFSIVNALLTPGCSA